MYIGRVVYVLERDRDDGHLRRNRVSNRATQLSLCTQRHPTHDVVDGVTTESAAPAMDQSVKRKNRNLLFR